MGIARFFAWIYNQHPDILVTLNKKQNFFTEKLIVDTYSLDVNAIIHPVCQKMFNYGGTTVPRFLHKPKIPTEKQVFQKICEKIEELRLLVNPQKQFIIAIDGVAGLSKSVQQRGRRFKSASERTSEKCSFDSNSITTGTEFMFNFSKYLHNYIRRQIETNWKHLTVIFSNEKSIGEGEHKIIRYIDKLKNMTHCIHSPDADLIMLTMGLDNPNICIVRENIYRDINCEYFVVNVNGFRMKMINMMKWNDSLKKQNDQQTTYDFILLCFLLGNDFLPHIPSLEISNDGLDLILQTYPLIGDHLVYRSKGELCINTNAIQRLFYILLQKEKNMLIKKINNKVVVSDSVLMESIIDKHFDFEKYKTLYYKKRLHDITTEKVCHEYFKGLLFVIRYYIDGIPDWHWFYPFHYSPLFFDMEAYIKTFNGEMKFDKNTPLCSFEQLLAVLPPRSLNLLPRSCQPLLQENSPIIDFYPEKFEIDLEGKKMEWEGHPILPFIDVSRLKTAYKSVEPNLSELEMKRVIDGKNIKYINDYGIIRTMFF